MQNKRFPTIMFALGMVLLIALPIFAGGAKEEEAPVKEEEEKVVTAPKRYNEAPMLAELVKARELLPVEERLPEEPLVVQPYERIGKYGGTLTVGDVRPDKFGTNCRPVMETFFKFHFPDYSKFNPNIATGYEFTNDNKTLTIYLRKGIKWSDGHPFNADDILFWYQAEFLNDKLMPVKRPQWVVVGQPMKLEKVDDYTFRMHFAGPYGVAISFFAGSNTRQGYMYYPKHYMEQFHIDYNPKADELAKEQGYESWDKLFHYKKYPRHGGPTISAYYVEEILLEKTVTVRNPFYWKVDPQGNQLPYID